MTLTSFTSFFTHHWDWIIVGLGLAALAVVVTSTWIIRENESGLVIKGVGPATVACRRARARRNIPPS